MSVAQYWIHDLCSDGKYLVFYLRQFDQTRLGGFVTLSPLATFLCERNSAHSLTQPKCMYLYCTDVISLHVLWFTCFSRIDRPLLK
jgi:hypothetical protein